MADDPSVFIGSIALMDALYETVKDHAYFTEVPDEGDPYIWCACGWRSDDLDRPWADAGHGLYVHLANALHAAAVEALQPLVVRKAHGRRAVAEEIALAIGNRRSETPPSWRHGLDEAARIAREAGDRP